MKLVFYRAKVMLSLTIGLSVLFSSHVFSNVKPNKTSCDLESHESLYISDFSLFEKMEVSLFREFSEGGIATVYRRDGVLAAVIANFLGETGKTEIKYYFDVTDNRQYLVEFIDYSYTRPIYDSSSKIASISLYKFFVCDGEKPNFPNSVDIIGKYNKAVSVLADVLHSD